MKISKEVEHMKDLTNILIKANESFVSQHKTITESYQVIRESEEKLRKEGKIKTFIVGGHHPLVRDTWLPQMSDSIGIEFLMVGHKLPARRAVGFMPDCTEFVFLLKDMASHALRTWAKKETQRLNIPMIETTQKVLNAVEDFKSWSIRMYDIGQDLKKQKALEMKQALERGEQVPEPAKKQSNYLYFDTFKSLVDNNVYSYFPYHSANDKENRDFWFERIKENLGDNYTYYTEDLEEYMDKYLAEIRKRCPLQLKSKWVFSYFDDKTLDPENLKNSSRVNNAFKVIFNTRLPDELRKEVSDLLHLLHGEDHAPIVVGSTITETETETVQPTTDSEHNFDLLSQVRKGENIEEPISPSEKVEEPIPSSEKVENEKPITTAPTNKEVQDQAERTVSFTDLSLTLKKGSQILLKQVKANKLDLTQSQDLDISIDKVEDGILYNVLIKY